MVSATERPWWFTMERKTSIERTLIKCACGWTDGAGRRSTTVDLTPNLESRRASVSPTGPAPTMATGVSATVPVVCVLASRCRQRIVAVGCGAAGKRRATTICCCCSKFHQAHIRPNPQQQPSGPGLDRRPSRHCQPASTCQPSSALATYPARERLAYRAR